ncbi:unnamed protein product [Prorocentrum cordatum]|uniref:Peptidase M14 domain-containing protein n=1 Tax=Prorocentrum cordatum TaxID=2364126 RepID=A0ABN9UHD5_9DINO|nr:unnamed protein product [Polarella glacialis]
MNRVFLMFGEHSRELISPESGLRLLKVLCGERDSAGHDIPQILKHSEFEMVLNGNPRSRLKVEDGDFCLRANPDGVDLNRNWDEKWLTQPKSAETNPGPKPFSEPETRIFRSLVTEFKPTTFVTVHSGTRGLYMPYAYDEHLASRNKVDMLRILKELDSSYCECPFGAAGKEVGYDCPGTSLDWVYDKMQTPYSFAFEIYVGGDDASLKQRWKEKVRTGGVALIQQGENLAHPHFKDLFMHHASDFVQTASSVNGTSSSLLGMDDLQCFSFYNPDSKKRCQEGGKLYTSQNWAIAYLDLSQKVVDHMRSNMSAI